MLILCFFVCDHSFLIKKQRLKFFFALRSVNLISKFLWGYLYLLTAS